MENNKALDDMVQAGYKLAAQLTKEFYDRLEVEMAIVLANSGIEQPYTAEKVSAAGYVVAYTPDGAARICQDGKPVSNVVYPAKFI